MLDSLGNTGVIICLSFAVFILVCGGLALAGIREVQRDSEEFWRRFD